MINVGRVTRPRNSDRYWIRHDYGVPVVEVMVVLAVEYVAS